MKTPELVQWGWGYAKYHHNNWIKYKLNEQAWKKLWEAQNGCCAICKIEFAHPTQRSMGREGVKCVVDHRHSMTGNEPVRGLLCFNCNNYLGVVNEDMRFLKGSIAYLEKHGTSTHYAERPAHAKPKEKMYDEVIVQEPDGEFRTYKVERT